MSPLTNTIATLCGSRIPQASAGIGPDPYQRPTRVPAPRPARIAAR